nr:hypothetical protein [Tanacetum cinerariifolium]
MANLAFAPQHNMIAYLEKTENNVGFHYIVDFFTSSSIHHSLTVSLTIYPSNIEQFWNTATSQKNHDEKQIHAIVDGKTIVIIESLVRRALLFTDANGVTCLTTEQIFKNLLLMRHEGGAGSLVRVATTASLDTQQDSSNIPKIQSKETLNELTPQGEGSGSGPREDRMEHDIKLTDPVPQTPHDSPLSGGHTPGSDEGSTTLKKLMDLCTTLLQKVLDLENVKTAQAKEIASLKKRVTKMEQRQCSRILDEDANIEMAVEDKGNGEKGGSTAETISTDRPDISAARPEVSTAEPKTPPTTATLFDDEDVTIADTLVKMKNQKAKEEGIAFKDTKKKDQDQIERDAKLAIKIQAHLDEEAKIERERQEEASKAALAKMYDEVQAQIDADHELAVRLTHEEKEKYTVEERSKLLAEFFKRRKKQLEKERAEAIRSKPPTKTQLRNSMMTYLKHTGRFTYAQLKSRRFKEIQKLYIKEQKWVDAFVPIGFEEDKKIIRSSKKRATGSNSKHKSPKKQKVNDQESKDSDIEHRKCLKVVPDDDKAIDYDTLDVKSLIVDCESQVL